mmetsp:Transcript_23585/g.54379  ORF Transcript_23585/g.54379 Transcript_23585/m.54379 type:complete len:288 (+) Transcript_23585:215-1078(+)
MIQVGAARRARRGTRHDLATLALLDRSVVLIDHVPDVEVTGAAARSARAVEGVVVRDARVVLGLKIVDRTLVGEILHPGRLRRCEGLRQVGRPRDATELFVLREVEGVLVDKEVGARHVVLVADNRHGARGVVESLRVLLRRPPRGDGGPVVDVRRDRPRPERVRSMPGAVPLHLGGPLQRVVREVVVAHAVAAADHAGVAGDAGVLGGVLEVRLLALGAREQRKRVEKGLGLLLHRRSQVVGPQRRDRRTARVARVLLVVALDLAQLAHALNRERPQVVVLAVDRL